MIRFDKLVNGGKIKNSVFGLVNEVMKDEFGELNYDEIKDLFVVSGEKNKVEVMLEREKEKLIKDEKGMSCMF
jgi:hypothetical protein